MRRRSSWRRRTATAERQPPGIGRLTHEQVREALRLLGVTAAPAPRAAALGLLRDTLSGYGTVRAALGRAPAGARAVFVRLTRDGPAPVADLLGRGWSGRGLLPPPLDWLQRRALVVVEDGRVHATAEARAGFAALTLEVAVPPEGGRATGVRAVPATGGLTRVRAAACVVVAPDAAALDVALGVPAAALEAVAPTVAVSPRPAGAVSAALRAAGVRLDADESVPAAPGQPALPGTAEEAVGPRALRALLQRAVADRRQVRLQYFASSRGGAATDRVVDPWAFRDDLLRGFCHLRGDERTFAVDRIGRALLLPAMIEQAPPAPD